MDQDRVARQRVLVTTDCGADMDDQWALAHVALNAEIEVCGVVTTHAPNLVAPAAETARVCTMDVFYNMPISRKPPVFAGSSRPLVGRRPHPNPGVDFILDEARRGGLDARLTVLVLGAGTDVASALLLDPSLGDRIEIVAMGFDGWPDGGDGFNVRNDITAWQVILESSAVITVGDATVTARDLAMTPMQAAAQLRDCETAGAFLTGLLVDWVDRYPHMARQVTGRLDAWPIWDEVTVAHLLGLTSVRAHPRPVLMNDLSFRHPAPTANLDLGRQIHWVTQIDSERLWQHLRRSLHDALSM